MMLPGFLASLLVPLRAALLWADTDVPETVVPNLWERLWGGFVLALVFGLLGIALMALGFKVFDWITPRLDIEKELSEKGNTAVAIVVAAVIIAVAIIVAVVIR